MFGGRFSLTRFSLHGIIDTDVKIQIFFVENIKNLISAGENTPIENNFS